MTVEKECEIRQACEEWVGKNIKKVYTPIDIDDVYKAFLGGVRWQEKPLEKLYMDLREQSDMSVERIHELEAEKEYWERLAWHLFDVANGGGYWPNVDDIHSIMEDS